MFSGFYYLKTGPVFIRFLFQPNKNRGASAASYGYLACLRVHAQVHTGLSTAYIYSPFAACLALLPASFWSFMWPLVVKAPGSGRLATQCRWAVGSALAHQAGRGKAMQGFGTPGQLRFLSAFFRALVPRL